MTVTASTALVCACIWSISPSAQERIGTGAGVPAPDLDPGARVFVLRSEPLEIAAAVVGAPYSADTLTVTTRLLADGNRLEERTEGSVMRDGQGNIRRVQTLAGLGGSGERVRIVTIILPAERVQFRLDEARKVAFQLRLPPPPAERDAPQRPDTKSVLLRPMLFDGVRAEGTRTITTLPAGTIGNERAIEIVNERWYAPELQTVVQTRRVDPRFGEVVYKLVNINRAEPPKHLFEVPADFTIEEQRPTRIQQRRPPPDPAGEPR
jgi:hypothetical protein